MSQTQPSVSIGMPVYNGELFIKHALDSILAQTFSDFELIICDNASTDGTQAICEDYAARDSRIRYYRNAENIGAANNFNRTVELSSGKYFKWAAHDDVLDPTFLERCVAVLDADPGVAVAFSRVQVIDDSGAVVQDYDVTLRTDDPQPHVRMHDLLWVPNRFYQVFGLMRADLLKKTRLIEPYSASDRVLVLGMAMFGRIHDIPENLFQARKHDNVSVRSHRTRHTRMIWFDPKNQGRILMPAWDLYFGYRRAVGRAPLSRQERAACFKELRHFLWDQRKTMWQDIVLGAKQVWVYRLRPRRGQTQPV